MKSLLSALGCVLIFLFSCKTDEIANSSSLPSNTILKIVIDKQGVKWIATDKGLVSFYNNEWRIYSNDVALNSGFTSDLSLDQSNANTELWIATNNGVRSGGVSSQSFSSNNRLVFSNGKLLNDTVYRVATNTNGAKFFGTKSGLSILKNNLWTSYLGAWGRGSDLFLSKNEITGIATSKGGWNYVSTKGGGVSRFQFTDAVTGATKFFQPWAYGLKSDKVFTVVVVNDSCQWYGTDMGAAYHTSHNTKADWTSYSIADGLICDTVYAIAQDAKATVWFGTHNGLSKFSDGNWTNYTVKDGLVANKINTVAIDMDGAVWIGTDNGISHFKNNTWKSFQMK